MRIDLIFPAYPPYPHAVGEYTALLADALRQQGVSTRVICAREQSVAGAVLKTPVSDELIDGVHVIKGFSLEHPEELVQTIQADPPTAVVLQYCPFSWGLRGRCPGLLRAWRQLGKTSPAVGRITMFHELWTETASWKARLMKVYQKAQATAIARSSHALGFSCDRWYQKLKDSVGNVPARVIPVGNNIPVVSISTAEARSRLGIPDDAPVLGIMGTGHRSRLFDFVAAAFRATVAAYPKTRLLYIGSDRVALAAALGGEENLRKYAVIADGWADQSETSKRLAAVDVYLCPFSDGVSYRRGSFIAGLAHGLVCLSTRTGDTDLELLKAANTGSGAIHLVEAQDREGFAQKAVALAGAHSRHSSGPNRASELYQRLFSWNAISGSLLEVVRQLPAAGALATKQPDLTLHGTD